MYIVYENENNLDQLRSKYLVLELDTVEIKKNEFVTAFGVVTNEEVLLQEIALLGEKARLHANLMKNYKAKQWEYCDQAINHLIGSFKGEFDSFYEIMSMRIGQLKHKDLKENWTGSVKPSTVIG